MNIFFAWRGSSQKRGVVSLEEEGEEAEPVRGRGKPPYSYMHQPILNVWTNSNDFELPI